MPVAVLALPSLPRQIQLQLHQIGLGETNCEGEPLVLLSRVGAKIKFPGFVVRRPMKRQTCA